MSLCFKKNSKKDKISFLIPSLAQFNKPNGRIYSRLHLNVEKILTINALKNIH